MFDDEIQIEALYWLFNCLILQLLVACMLLVFIL